MRLKTFNARTMSEAMKMVRDHLGEDAIIVSTQRGEGGKGVRLTAALDGADPEFDAAPEPSPLKPPAKKRDTIEYLSDALSRHGVAPNLAERMLRSATTLGIDDPILALAGALDDVFSFQPINDLKPTKPIILIGPPGQGKTLTVAKIAARAALARRPVHLLTTDTEKAGGFEQLQVFGKVLKVEVVRIDTSQRLKETLSGYRKDELTIIDTAGRNPFSPDDMGILRPFVQAAQGDTCLVMAAGTDPLEAAEVARAFAEFGASRLIITRLDLARRLGSLLVAAEAGRLKLADASVTSAVVDGLNPLNPVAMARLLLPDLVAEEAAAPLKRAYS
jgi:flagellar biosynthesis protein FlhF